MVENDRSRVCVHHYQDGEVPANPEVEARNVVSAGYGFVEGVAFDAAFDVFEKAGAYGPVREVHTAPCGLGHDLSVRLDLVFVLVGEHGVVIDGGMFVEVPFIGSPLRERAPFPEPVLRV